MKKLSFMLGIVGNISTPVNFPTDVIEGNSYSSS
jgi:hypothetical protein